MRRKEKQGLRRENSTLWLVARVAKLDHSTERRSCGERRSIGGMGTQEGKIDLVKGIARVKGELHHYTERRSWRKREPRNHKGKTSLVNERV